MVYMSGRFLRIGWLEYSFSSSSFLVPLRRLATRSGAFPASSAATRWKFKAKESGCSESMHRRVLRNVTTPVEYGAAANARRWSFQKKSLAPLWPASKRIAIDTAGSSPSARCTMRPEGVDGLFWLGYCLSRVLDGLRSAGREGANAAAAGSTVSPRGVDHGHRHTRH
jgi:hypothetical protein